MTDNDPTRGAAADAGGRDGSGLPVLPPLAAVVEVLLLVVLPGLVDYFVPAFPSLNEMQPHFFWLPVLLLSVQYGTVSGLLAAGAAIAMAALLGWPEQEIGENHFTYLLRIWLQPVLWLATAVVLGQFRLRQIERAAALSREVAELGAQRQAISEHARNLRARCEDLERVIATRRDPDARLLLAALGRMQSPDAKVAETALNEALALGFGDCTLSVWLRDGARLRLAHRLGAATAASERTSLEPGEALYAAIVEQGRLLSVALPGDERELAGAGLAAAPIADANGGVRGMLLLERAQAAEIDEGTALRLAALAGLIDERLRDEPVTAEAPTARPLRPVLVEAATAQRSWRQVRWRSGSRRTRAGSRSG
jgi:hypothetical protein